MTEPVKVRIETEADAAKIVELKKRIEDLRRAAEAYDKKPGMQTAAGSARAEARGLEQELTRHTRERHREERKAAKEKAREERERIALEKAGVGRLHSAAHAGMSIAQGESPATAAMSGLMNLGAKFGVIGAILGTVASAAVGSLAMLSQQRDDIKARRLGIAEEDTNARYRMGRNRGVYGSSGALLQSSLEDQEQIAQRNSARAALEEKARVKWYNPSTWTWGGLRQNEGQKELADNVEKNADQSLRMVEAKKAAQQKFQNEEGGLEIDALRGRAKRSQAGQREAFTAQMGAQWLAKYKEAMAAGADDKMAKEMGDLTVQNEVRDRQAQAGAGLVDARSGGAEIAAAARWGQQAFNMDQVAAKIDGLNQTVQQGNQASQLVKHEK